MHVDGRALSAWLTTIEAIEVAAADAAQVHGRNAVRLQIITDL